ncbi:hypothetical protein [Pseudomonas sp. TWP3-1]|uniref:hypothetical protein n=1 Tax=unclassified Pseudomonas TaxID=196821 RepID=UPI003CFACB52
MHRNEVISDDSGGADLRAPLICQPNKERGRAATAAVLAPGTYGRSLVTGKGRTGAVARPLHPLKSFRSFNWKVASSEAFTLINQFWPLIAERSNFAQIKLNKKVLSDPLTLEKQPTKNNSK